MAEPREFVSRRIAWCRHGRFHEGDYEGPRHVCPEEDGGEYGESHYMIPRRAWVCSECDVAYFQKKKPDLEKHECEDARTTAIEECLIRL